MGEHFNTVRGRSYDVGEVDEFVARLDRVRAGAEEIGGHEVRGVVFRPVRGGYAMAEVDAWLHEVQAAFDDGSTEQSDSEAHIQDLLNHPAGQRFPLAGRLQRGYVIDDVDGLLARVRAGGMTAEDVRAAVFRETRDGYDEAAVDAWLDVVAQHLRSDDSP